ncbi:hypothetical protein GCM10020219_077920 [Nonomuraea dietziae]
MDFPGQWQDLPRTWDNPGFVVRYAHARAAAVLRWRPRADVAPRPVHRLRAVRPPRQGRPQAAGRAAEPQGGARPWMGRLLPRLALAYHDAHERAPAVPRGEEEPGRPSTRPGYGWRRWWRVVLPGPERI